MLGGSAIHKRLMASRPLLASPTASGDQLSTAARCKRIMLAVLATIVITSELSGTALLLWFGHQPLEDFSPWLQSQEAAGTAIFLAVWVGGSVFCLPSTPLWLLGGFCFKQNFLLGLLLNALGCWLGSTISFGLGT